MQGEIETARPEVSLELYVETPENVVLAYQLAGPAIRLCAYILDVGIRVLAGFVVLMVVAIGGFALPGLSMGLFLLFLFFAEWGYFVVCEGFFNGKTLGKHICGLRVIHERGYPLTFWAAMLRNLIRAADALPLYGVGFVAMLTSRKLQRFGDLVAGTVVITERRVVLPREPVILAKIDPLRREDLGRSLPDHRVLALIDQFLGRRYVLTYNRGHVLARTLAVPLARALDYRGDPRLVEQYPMAFLARVYVTYLRAREEREAERPVAVVEAAHE
jgi:uncharacterized RDD family membrane protein YckC